MLTFDLLYLDLESGCHQQHVISRGTIDRPCCHIRVCSGLGIDTVCAQDFSRPLCKVRTVYNITTHPVSQSLRLNVTRYHQKSHDGSCCDVSRDLLSETNREITGK